MLIKGHIGPHFPDCRIGQAGNAGSGFPEVPSGRVHGCLSFGDRFDVGVGLVSENGGKASVKYRVQFRFRVREMFTCRFNRVGTPQTFDLEGTETPEELVKHIRFNSLTRGGHRMGTFSCVRPAFTAVVGPGLSVTGFAHRVLEGVPAGRTSKDAGQDAGAPSAPTGGDTSHHVRRLKGGSVNQGFVSLHVHDALSAMDFPEVRPVADEVTDGTNRPRPVELSAKPVGHRLPRVTGRPAVERLTHKVRVRPRLKPPVRFDISEGDGPTNVNTSFHGVLTGNHPVFGVAFNLELSDRGQDGGDHSSRGAGGVQAFRDGEQGGIMVGEDFHEFPEVLAGPSETVEFRHNDAFGLPGCDSFHCGIQSGPMAFLAGLVKVLENGADLFAVKLRPVLNCAALFRGRYERLALSSRNPGHPHVSVAAPHAGLAYTAYPSPDGGGRLRPLASIALVDACCKWLTRANETRRGSAARNEGSIT